MPGEWWGTPANWDSVVCGKLIVWKFEDLMQKYRKLETVEAVQYQGEPIEGVTCEGTETQRAVGGCDNTRAHFPHAHTRAIGGLNVLKAGDWILPQPGGPFMVLSDEKFRGYCEVPVVAPVVAPVNTAPPAIEAGVVDAVTMFGLGQAPTVQPPVPITEPPVAGDAGLEHC